MTSRIMDHVWCAFRNVETANRKDLRKDLGYSSLPVPSVHGSDVASLTARLAILRAFSNVPHHVGANLVSLASADVARSSCTGATLGVGQSSPASSGHRIHRVLPCSVCNLSVHCHLTKRIAEMPPKKSRWPFDVNGCDVGFDFYAQAAAHTCTRKKRQAAQCLVGDDDRYTDS